MMRLHYGKSYLRERKEVTWWVQAFSRMIRDWFQDTPILFLESVRSLQMENHKNLSKCVIRGPPKIIRDHGVSPTQSGQKSQRNKQVYRPKSPKRMKESSMFQWIFSRNCLVHLLLECTSKPGCCLKPFFNLYLIPKRHLRPKLITQHSRRLS